MRPIELGGCHSPAAAELYVRLSRMTVLERRCRITKRPAPGHPHFEGFRDELVISNRDLTAAELQELIKK